MRPGVVSEGRVWEAEGMSGTEGVSGDRGRVGRSKIHLGQHATSEPLTYPKAESERYTTQAQRISFRSSRMGPVGPKSLSVGNVSSISLSMRSRVS
jgi:hypothetical protein